MINHTARLADSGGAFAFSGAVSCLAVARDPTAELLGGQHQGDVRVQGPVKRRVQPQAELALEDVSRSLEEA